MKFFPSRGIRLALTLAGSLIFSGALTTAIAQSISTEFRETAPGVKSLNLEADYGEIYSLEISPLLQQGEWSKVKEWYGLNHEVEQNLFATPQTSGPATGDANFSDPAVGLVIQKGVGGTGVVVSWRSLDNASAKQTYLPSATLAANWPTVLIKNAGGHRYFMRKLAGNTAVNPAATAPTGTYDSLMFSAFQGNLGAFNTAINSGNTASDDPALPPKVSESGSKQFYRIGREISPDTDGDGILDKDEFQIGISPFSANSDGDSWGDLDELINGFDGIDPNDAKDTDGDGIPDFQDAHANDSVIDWAKIPDVLYQWTPRTVPSNRGATIGIGEDETIYFANGVLKPDGTWTTLIKEVITPTFEIYDARAIGFNKSGQMVGVANMYWPATSFRVDSAAVYWPTATSNPVMIGRGDPNLYSAYAPPTITDDGGIQLQGIANYAPGGAFYSTSNSGAAKTSTSQLSYNYFVPFGNIITQYDKTAFLTKQLGAGFKYFVNPNLTTYHDLVVYKNGSYTTIAGNYPITATIDDIEIIPNGRAAIAGSRSGGSGCFFERPNGTWAQSANIGSATGGLNKRGEFLSATNIWRNGQYTSLFSLSPQVASAGFFNFSGEGINNSGAIFGRAFNVSPQPTKPTQYGILRPVEVGVDVITRDELTGNFNNAGGLIEQSRPIPSVNLTVTGTEFLANGALEIDISCTVRDPLSEILPNAAERLQELNIYMDGVLVETIPDLPSLASNAPVAVWQPYPSQVTITRTYTIPAPRTGAIGIRAETSVNAAGNQGWDIASVLLTRAGGSEPELSPGTDLALRLTGAFNNNSVDTIQCRFGTGPESPLTETTANSRQFIGTASDGGLSKTVTLWMDTVTALSSGQADKIEGWAEIVGSSNTTEILLRWNETTANSSVFNPSVSLDVEGTDNGANELPPLRVEHIEKGTKSLEGALNPFVVRVAVKAGTLAQIGTTYRMEVDGVSHPVVQANSLLQSQTPPVGMEWGYVAENGTPKLFVATPSHVGSLIPANVFNRSALNAVLWSNASGQPAANGIWSLAPEGAVFNYTAPPTGPPVPLGFSALEAEEANYTEEELFVFYDLIFKEYGKILKDSMVNRGLVIKIQGITFSDWTRQNVTPRAKQLGEIPELWIDDDLDNVSDAAVALFEGLYSLKKWHVRDDLRLAVFDAVLDEAITNDGDFEIVYRELHEARLGAIGDALEAFATAAEIGLSIAFEPFDYVMSLAAAAEHYQKGEIVQASTTVVIAAIPFVCGRISKIGRVLRVEIPGNPFSVLPSAQEALAKTVLKNITRVERMEILGPYIRSGDLDSDLVEQLYKSGFLKFKNKASKVLEDSIELQLGISKGFFEIAHHDLPVRFDLEFLKRGIDINKGTDTGRFLPSDFHKKLHNEAGWRGVRGSPWNYQWNEFFIEFPQATAEQILDFRDRLRALTSNPNVDVSKIPWEYAKPTN